MGMGRALKMKVKVGLVCREVNQRWRWVVGWGRPRERKIESKDRITNLLVYCPVHCRKVWNRWRVVVVGVLFGRKVHSFCLVSLIQLLFRLRERRAGKRGEPGQLLSPTLVKVSLFMQIGQWEKKFICCFGRGKKRLCRFLEMQPPFGVEKSNSEIESEEARGQKWWSDWGRWFLG